MQNPNHTKLEFDIIKQQLAEMALSARAKARCLTLAPFMGEDGCRDAMAQTTGARRILDAHGNPPLTAMPNIDEVLTLCKAGALPTCEQLTEVGRFLTACARMQAYLRKAQNADEAIAAYAGGFDLLPQLSAELERCIRAGRVDSTASGTLAAVRRKIEQLNSQVQSQLAALAQSKKQWLSDGGVVQRNGRFVLPVRREYKSKVNGTVVELSSTGGTVFIEPAAVAKLHQQLAGLQVEEDNEVRRVLYTLGALVDENAKGIRLNVETMEALDFLFAKAKHSAALGAGPVKLTAARTLRLQNARHPLLPKAGCVPLSLALDEETRGVIITGPNTGGKTVALKTVGLLSLMAQCGLHVTADAESLLCLHGAILCDVGDGQSISENLSTFSSHMTTIIGILAEAGPESLVLLDELGSGTDPAEGMGIAIAVLEALRQTGCMLVATTHYPEVKQYAGQAAGFTNARMAFDRETLQPTYRLEVGLAGESCALYIARRLGLPEGILQHAHRQAYAPGAGAATPPVAIAPPGGEGPPVYQSLPPKGKIPARRRQIQPTVPRGAPPAAAKFEFGDSVLVYPKRERGIVFHPANEKGEVGVQVKGQKSWVPHKRLKLLAKAEALYPPDYDFSVVFDTVANRKARKQMEKGHHIAGNVIHHDGFETGDKTPE